MTDIASKILALLDAEAARHPHGIKSVELENAIHAEVVALLADAERDLDAEAEALTRAVASRGRKARRTTMGETIDYILDGFASGDGDGAYVDPLMEVPFPLGTQDGMVKALKYWTEDDWTGSALAAYDNAANVTAAAQEHADRVERVKGSMRARGAEMFGVRP